MSCSAATAPTAPPSLPQANAQSGKKKTSAQSPGGDEAASTAAATGPNSNDQASLNYLAQLRSASALLEAVIDALQTATQVRPVSGDNDDVEQQ